jgi:hypothetical protein
MAEKTIEKFLARAVQLYGQEKGESFGSPLLGLYVHTCSDGLGGCITA